MSRRINLTNQGYTNPTTRLVLKGVADTMEVASVGVPTTVRKGFDLTNNILDGLINMTESYKIPKTEEQLKLKAEEDRLEQELEISEMKLRLKELQDKLGRD